MPKSAHFQTFWLLWSPGPHIAQNRGPRPNLGSTHAIVSPIWTSPSWPALRTRDLSSKDLSIRYVYLIERKTLAIIAFRVHPCDSKDHNDLGFDFGTLSSALRLHTTGLDLIHSRSTHASLPLDVADSHRKVKIQLFLSYGFLSLSNGPQNHHWPATWDLSVILKATGS